MSEPMNAERVCWEALRNGATREEVVGILHEKGLTIIATIKAVRAVFTLSLGEAKQLVTAHPAWRAQVEANQPLHEALEKAAAEGPDRIGSSSAPSRATRKLDNDGEE